jgi:YVTN family beta-propeller protein
MGFRSVKICVTSVLLVFFGTTSSADMARAQQNGEPRADSTVVAAGESSAAGANKAVWVATNQTSHGDLEPITGSGSTLNVEVGDVLNSFAATPKGTLGLATASDMEGSSQAFVVSPSTRQVFSLAGTFSNLDGAAVLPDDLWGYVADQGFSESAALDAVNLTSHDVYPITSLPGFSPALSAVAACPNGKQVVATDNGDNQLDIFSGVDTDPTDPVVTTVGVGSDPDAVACYQGFAYVANEGSSTLDVVDLATASVTSAIAVGTSPDAVAVGSGKIYVANRGSDDVSIIKVGSRKVKSDAAVGSEPDGIAVSDALYVINYGSGSASVLTLGGTLLQTISGLPSPEAISVVKQ